MFNLPVFVMSSPICPHRGSVMFNLPVFVISSPICPHRGSVMFNLPVFVMSSPICPHRGSVMLIYLYLLLVLPGPHTGSGTTLGQCQEMKRNGQAQALKIYKK